MSLSPFDIKGKGQIIIFIHIPCHSPPLTSRATDKTSRSKPTHSPPLTSRATGGSKPTHLPFSPHVEEAFCRSDEYWSGQAPPEFMLNLQTYFSIKYMTLPITKDSYLHQLSIQVDLHMRLNYPTKWVYKFDSATQPRGFTKFDSATQPSGFTKMTSPYMTEYYNFTS